MKAQAQPAVVVLASGRGERFVASGGQGSKLQALLGGKAVLERTLDAVRASGLPFHLENAGHDGMGDSIAAGVRATPDAGGWLILPGDLPLVLPESLIAVATALASHQVVLPIYQGRQGHPVGFAPGCGSALKRLKGSHGAASIVRTFAALNAVCRLEVDDEGTVTDIDTVQDLRAAQRLLASR